MNQHPRRWHTAAGLVAAATLLAAGCGGGSSGDKHSGRASTAGHRGGTLDVLLQNEPETLDPARVYSAVTMNVERLFTRTLTTYKATSGKAGTDLVPDLATDLGQHDDGCRTWTFHLKDGLRYEDGSPVTTQDIKYGVMRSFDDGEVGDGPQYNRQYLTGVDNYKGPWTTPDGNIDQAVSTPDDHTIVFHLKRTVCDFNYTVAFAAYAAVPRAKDTHLDYGHKVFSDGPYRFGAYAPGKSLELDRNPYWKKSTDPVRGAYPDKIVFQYGIDQNILLQRLISDQGDDRHAVTIDTPAAAEMLPQIEGKAAVKSRTISGPDGYVWYLGINNHTVPNVAVRKAITYALSKEEILKTCGGVEACGDYATGFTSPTVPSYRKQTVYKVSPQGDPARAKQILQQAGVPTPVKLTFAYRQNEDNQKVFEAVQRSLGRDGLFQLTPVPVQKKVYYSSEGIPSRESDLVWVSWGADWASGSTVIPPIFDGRQILPQGNVNFSQLNDPTIDKLMDKAADETDNGKQQQMWGDVETEILKRAASVPVFYDKGIFVHGSGVRGTYMHYFYGSYDMVSLSVV
ncbi:MAG: ABC transporter substrate-binding protein [Mycobacteriales bacterium]